MRDKSPIRKIFQMAAENPNMSAAEFLRRFYGTPQDHITISGSTIVTWRFSDSNIQKATAEQIRAIEERIQPILTANPNADLTRYESALGIEVVDVQRKGPIPGKGFMG